jgi:SAM-dependent methyltransferase
LRFYPFAHNNLVVIDSLKTPLETSSHKATRHNSGVKKRAARALERQLTYQQSKAEFVRAHEVQVIASMQRASKRVRDVIEEFHPITDETRVIEVGSGSTGLIFYFGAKRGIGLDPLSVSCAGLFPRWQRNVPTVAAQGECLPFRDCTFDVVICDNVVDHAESPATIAKELIRVLVPGGVLYFTVNVHHPMYAVAAGAHSTWNAAGVPFEIGPFADHTVHLTPSAAKELFEHLPINVLKERCGISEAKERAQKLPARHIGDRLKRVFYKNAVFELVARKSE